MEIISTTDVSRPGNDVYLKESYSLVECLGLYAVIRFYKVSGWYDREEVEVVFSSSSKAEAGKIYKNYCEYYKD